MTARSLIGSLAALALAFAAPAIALAAQDVHGRPAQKPVKAADLGPPRPAPEMAQLKAFDGSWTCQGTMKPSPFGPGGQMTSTMRSRTELGGFWQSGTVNGASPGLPPFQGQFHATYDAVGKRLVMLWVDNMGGWSHTTASDWKGNIAVFAGDSFMAGKRFAARDTFTRGRGTLRHVSEMEIDGKWTLLGDETCRRETR
jgi:uncharacterized protein DUF1579